MVKIVVRECQYLGGVEIYRGAFHVSAPDVQAAKALAWARSAAPLGPAEFTVRKVAGR